MQECPRKEAVVAHRILHHTGRVARRILITIAGVIVILAGIAMLVLPGPGLLTIVLGLMILGAEFEFARRWVARIKFRMHQALDYGRSRFRRKNPPPAPPDTP
jgi:uncharacterized protein (TIGR02611 family)